MKKIFVVLLCSIFVLTGCTKKDDTVTSTKKSTYDLFSEAIDNNKEYGLELVRVQQSFRVNEELGYRTSGSQAEFELGEKLFEEMKNIGLSNVHKDEFSVDGWEYKKGEISFKDVNGNEVIEPLGGHAVDAQINEEVDLVFVNKATEADLKDIDVTGKWVLAEINQREEWWVNYPAYQAYLKGAKGVIAVNISGYGEVSPDSIVTQDICGPEYAPIFTISVNTYNKIKEIMVDNETKININIESNIIKDTKTYNIIGEIPSESTDKIVLSAHYDAYWEGFQDDGTAISIIFDIAKALIDSGYKPKKTILIIAHAAEEWGTVDTRYDWSVGAHKQITYNTPNWSKEVFALLNFESPGMEQLGYLKVRTNYEYNNFIKKTISNFKLPEKYSEITTEYPLKTWSDDYAYQNGGVPSIRNAYTNDDYDNTIYHTAFDNEETYNHEDYINQAKLYGYILMAYDNVDIIPIDFTLRFSTMLDSLGDEKYYQDANIDYALLKKSIEDVIESSKALYEKVEKGELSKEANIKILEAFKFAEDNFTKLTWEDALLFPNQHNYNNIENLDLSIKSLEENDSMTAYDEYLWLIDNNWYAYYFDKETYNFFTNQVLEKDPERLNWGIGKIISHCDLYDVINSLEEKYDTNEDLSNEISILKEKLEAEKEIFNKTVQKQIEDLKTFKTMLDSIK